MAFIEAVLFIVFTWELIGEQLESVEDNQTYIDDRKKLWGKQQSFYKNLEALLGKDFWWWLAPTHPCL